MNAKTKAETPPPLELVLKSLAERRTALDKIDDKLSSLIRRIELVLRKQVSTRITLRIDTSQSGVPEDFLTFGKHDGKFMLLIEHCIPTRDGGWEVAECTPLTSTSREMRTRIFAEGHVEQLIRSAHEQVSQQIVMREKALAAAERLANALAHSSMFEDSTTSDPSSDDGTPS